MSDPSTGGDPGAAAAGRADRTASRCRAGSARRLHRRLGLDAPPGRAPMQRAAGLEYEIGGNPEGEVVLFIHAGTATAYAPLMDEPDLRAAVPARPLPPPRVRRERPHRRPGHEHRP